MDLDLTPHQVLDVCRRRRTQPVNNLLPGLLIRLGEKKTRAGFVGHADSSGGHIRDSFFELGEDVGMTLCYHEFYLYSQRVGERLGQVVFEAGRTVWIFHIGSRTSAGEYNELARCFDL